MKILSKNLKEGKIKIQITNNEDLWYLSHILEEGDVVSSSTERKIKIGEEPNIKVIRKRVYLTISATKIEYEPEHNSLRVLGKITEGPEDVSKGSHHSFNLKENEDLKIIKPNGWQGFQLKKIDESTKKKNNILLVVFDREEAKIINITNKGYEVESEIKGEVAKKNYDVKSKNFYKELNEIIEEKNKVNNYNKIIIASPSFWKEYLEKELSQEIKKKTAYASVNSSDHTSIKELITKKLVKDITEINSLEEIRISEEILEFLGKDLVCYGEKESYEKISIGAVKKLVVTEKFLVQKKEEGKYKEIDSKMKETEQMEGEVFILTNKDASKNIEGLGGIAGILRWKS